MNYVEVILHPKPGCTDAVCELLPDGFAVDDPDEIVANLETMRQYWDYVAPELTAPRPVSVKAYFADEAAATSLLATVASLVESSETRVVAESDWEDAWKPYWQPTAIGEELVIVPSWKTVLRLDPGMLFGTGAHATTAMCLEALERAVRKGGTSARSALDLGCGSGILAIAAMLLGVPRAVGYDIDVNMPRVAGANAALNGVAPEFVVRDVVANPIVGTFDIILANIVADVIINLAPLVPRMLSERGVFICSGIIAERGADVADALTAAGLVIAERTMREDWLCLCASHRAAALSGK